MNEQISSILKTHVEYELNRFKNGGYRQTIEEEVTAAFGWMEQIKLQDIVGPEQISRLIQRNVIDNPVAGGITELAGEMSRKVLASDKNNKTVFEDIFNRKQFDDIVDKVISLKNVRADLIRQLFYSPVYSRLISNILCNGIKEYLLVENFVVHNISRFFSLIYFGQTTFNTVMTPLESYIEKQVKKYIDLNIDNIVSYSEKYLVKFLNENQILEIADEIWKSLAPCPLTDYFKQIDGNDMEDFIIIGHEFWLHFRQTNYFKEISEELVYYFFEKYGDQRLDIIVEDLGVSKELIINEVVEIVSPGFEKALEIGYLEDRIRARLASFYSSDLMQDHFDRIQQKQGRA